MSVNFYVHDAAGEILRTGTCPADSLMQQAEAGETVRMGVADDLTQQFNTTTMQLENKPVYVPALQEVRDEKIQFLKTQYMQATRSGYTCSNGILFDADLPDIQRLLAGHTLATSLGAPTMDIRDFNNAVHTAVPLAEIWTMLEELGVNYQTILGNKWAKEAAVASATTLPEIEAVAW